MRIFTKISQKNRAFILSALGIVLLFAGLLGLAVSQTYASLEALSRLDSAQAAVHARRAQLITTPLRFISFGQADIAGWDSGLRSVSHVAELHTSLNSFTVSLAHKSDEPPAIGAAISALEKLEKELSVFAEAVPRSLLIKNLLPAKRVTDLERTRSSLAQANTVLRSLETGVQKWVVVFQNTDELRATGGFAGSYAIIEFQDGVIADVIIEDIYDADGQFQGFVSPPAGIREYTSSGRGLRLPDANWWPDFPKSAQIMLQFFALSDRSQLRGLAVINVDAVARLLEITGPIWLPDYQIELTAETLTEALRSDREAFFPGSIQKKQLLTHSYTMIKQKLSELSGDQLLAVIQLFASYTGEKQLQVFAIDPELQSLFANMSLTGEIGLQAPVAQQLVQSCNCQPFFFGLVESNVGINKANAAVKRSVLLDWDPDSSQLTATITFQHDGSYHPTNPKESTGYVNYQRLMSSTDLRVTAVALDGRPLSSWDEERITTSRGEPLSQTGFLIPLPSGETRTVVVTAEHTTANTPNAAILYKQPGLAATPYHLTLPTQSHSFELTKDTLILLD